MSSSPVPSLQHWLESILLPQYLDVLTDRGYDTVYKCVALTSSDLDQIGISLPGHKKRILSRLAKFRLQPECMSSESAEVSSGDSLPVTLHNVADICEENVPHAADTDTSCQEHSCESRRSDTYSEYENFEQVLAGLLPSPSLQDGNPGTLRKAPVPTPRQTRTSSVESQVSVTSQCEPALSLPPALPELVAEFDPLTAPTSTANSAGDGQNMFAEESTGDSLTPVNVSCLPETDGTESLKFSTVNEVSQYNGTYAVDPSCNGVLQALVSPGESVNRERHDTFDHNWTELQSKSHPESADAAGDGSCVSCSSSRLSDDRGSYLEVWNCSSSRPVHDVDEANSAVFLPAHREIIKSDESLVLPPSPSSDDTVFHSPPVPKKRSTSQLSASNQSVKSSDPSPSLVPVRAALAMPYQDSERMLQTSMSKMDENTSTVGSEMSAASSVLPGLPTVLEDDSKLPRMEVPQMLSDEEEQTRTVSFNSPPLSPVCNVSVPPRPRPREGLRLTVISSNNVCSPPPNVKHSPPPVSPKTVQPPRPSTPPPRSPLEKVIAIGGVNMPGMSMRGTAATQSNSKASMSGEVWSPVSSEVSGVVTSGSVRTPPVPPVKYRRPSEVKRNTYSFAKSLDDDTGDSEDLDTSADVKDMTFADSDGCLSDGGEFYSMTSQRPLALRTTIPIIKTEKVKCIERKGHLFKLESPTAAVGRLGSPWRKLWVTFDKTALRYYSSRKSFVSSRIIPVSVILNVEQSIKNGDVHNYQFKLSTIDRVFTFAADDRDELSLWTSTIMQAIIEAKVDFDNFVEGGEMHTPILQGFVRMDNVKGKLYLALQESRLCYYKTFEDFKAYQPIHQVEMQTASVKELSKCRLQLHTPYVGFILLFDTHEELNKWKTMFKDVIAQSLGDDSIIKEVYVNSSNQSCADCDAEAPDWASVTLGITLCKRCAGIHRSLDWSKIRSLRMDSKVWKPSIIQLMTVIGNDNANKFWEWHLSPENKINTEADEPTRKEFIYNKYRDRIYFQLHPLHGDQAALDAALCKSVQFGDVIETMQLLFSGANILCESPKEHETPMQLAKQAHQMLQMEFIYQNGGQKTSAVRRSIDLSHCSFLLKTGSNPRDDFRKRWCTLENGSLSYFDNDKCTVANATIERREMLSLNTASDDRMEFSFELATTKNAGRVFLFAASTAEDRRVWMSKLGKNMAHVMPDDVSGIGEFDRGGNVFTRIGAASDWQTTWIHLHHKTLYIYDEEEKYVKHDLRKAKSVAYVQLSEKCFDAFDEGAPVVVDMPNGQAIYIQSDLKKDTRTWYNALQKALSDISNVLSDQSLSADNVPLIVDKCINFVATYGLEVEGIYRICGQHTKVTRLFELFAADGRTLVLKPEEFQIHDVASVLRRFIRSLDKPLLTDALRCRWIETASLSDEVSKLQWYKYLLGELPKVNYSTLKRIITHLARIAELEELNKMPVVNLASIFGPIMMNVDNPDALLTAVGYESTVHEISVIKDLINNHQQLFGVKDEELEQQKKIDEAAKKIERLLTQPSNTSLDQEDLLCGIFVNSREGKELIIRVSRTMRAREVLEDVIVKSQPGVDTSCWALFEVTCDGDLERPLHSMEIVAEVVKKWSSWPVEFCHGVHLCAKQNFVYININNVACPQMSLFGELRLAEKKSHRKYCFEFRQYSLSYRTSSKAATPVAVWNIENLVIYLGMQQLRNPPTRYSVSFYSVTEKLTSPYFGHSVSFTSEQELYRWLSAMLHAQHPEGLMSPRNSASALPQSDTCSPVIPPARSISDVGSAQQMPSASTLIRLPIRKLMKWSIRK